MGDEGACTWCGDLDDGAHELCLLALEITGEQDHDGEFQEAS